MNLRAAIHPFHPATIAQEIKQLAPKFQGVWLVVDDASEQWKYHVAKVWPKVEQTSFDLEQELLTAQPPDWIRLRRGNSDALADPIGEFDLVLPDCN